MDMDRYMNQAEEENGRWGEEGGEVGGGGGREWRGVLRLNFVSTTWFAL